MSLQEFYGEFMKEIQDRAGGAANLTESVFVERMCEILEGQGVVSDFGLVGYRQPTRGVRLDAWAQDDESGSLVFVVAEFVQNDSVQRLTQSVLDQAFKRAERFYILASADAGDWGPPLRESALALDVARLIHDQAGMYTRVSFIVVTNCELGPSVAPPVNQVINQRQCHYDVWDIGRLYRLEASGRDREDVVIDLTGHMDGGIPCLPAFTGEKGCKSYLLAFPGRVLAEIYGEYGERLLEQNVRTFLQFRGKVNKGMRVTIDTEPHMFFSYNNGITATAEEVSTTPDHRHMLSVLNFQIVNGGQTTASIFTAGKKDAAKLADVYVQAKLSIIPPDDVETVVPKISEYANTQNKVNAADFFSNHPFHLRLEEISRRLWAPAAAGSFQETHWFYERTRGQYANAQANLAPAEKRKFLLQNPPQHVITKTDLAKLVHSFEFKPHWVSCGAQKNFSKFASAASQAWETRADDINDLYYRRIVGMAILFRSLDREVMQQAWYTFGYKANIVTYALAKFTRGVTDAGMRIDFGKIWHAQAVSPELLALVVKMALYVNDEIQKRDAATSNVTEWCKKELCWQRMESAAFDVAYTDAPEVQPAEIADEAAVNARRKQVVLNGITAQTSVVEKGASYWRRMQQWVFDHSLGMAQIEEGVLQVACSIPNRIPSEKQARVLVRLEERARKAGFA